MVKIYRQSLQELTKELDKENLDLELLENVLRWSRSFRPLNIFLTYQAKKDNLTLEELRFMVTDLSETISRLKMLIPSVIFNTEQINGLTLTWSALNSLLKIINKQISVKTKT